MIRSLALLLLAFPCAAWQGPAQIAEQMRKAELDPNECYRVRDVHFSRGDDLRFYLTDGFLIFSKPIGGRITSAVFSTDTEGGDAEILVIPPLKGERVSLAAFTESPNLDEHFRSALFLFTDDSAEVLKKEIEERGEVKRSPERGTLLAGQWNSILANLSGSFSVRTVQHLLSGIPKDRGLFYAAMQGRKLGNFDAIYDPDARDQVFLGQLKTLNNKAYYDTWAQFPARPFRTGARKPAPSEVTMTNFRIAAKLSADLHLKVVTKATVTPNQTGLGVFGFEISEGMTVTKARINGQEAELFTRESLRENLIRRHESVLFLVVAPQKLEAGKAYEFEFEHEGDVVKHAGRNVYYVASRSNWYPRSGFDFAAFDLQFTYPATLQIVFPGEIKDDHTEGALRTTRRIVAQPIRLAGFNLGQYESAIDTRGPLSVEVFANKQVEFALRQRTPELVISQPVNPFPRRAQNPQPPVSVSPPAPPDPTARLKAMASEIGSAFEFMASNFGPPALPALMVSPIPGAFGQGFPGLVYLSTISYLDVRDRPLLARDGQHRMFFSEMLHTHETAHQWWGNVVSAATAQDDWLMEALANYTAILFLEKKKGPKAAHEVLMEFRQNLLKKLDDGRTTESAGPIRLGTRLSNSQSPGAWNDIVYGKGSWVLHMLRKRMGDAEFYKMLNEFCQSNRFRTVSTLQFEELATRYLPKGYGELFFEHWVEGTGIPTLTMTNSYKLGKLTVTVEQTGVEEQVSLQVPVEIQTAPGKSQTVWVSTGADPTAVTIPLKSAPLKVALDPENTILRN